MLPSTLITISLHNNLFLSENLVFAVALYVANTYLAGEGQNEGAYPLKRDTKHHQW